MNKIVILCGLIASGKSRFAKEYSERIGAVVVSSDEYREKEYGNQETQGNNQSLFDKIHSDIIFLLKSGNNVIFDATNLNRKHRMALLQKIPAGIRKECFILATEYEKCIAYNKLRDRQVPENVINRYWKSFQVPCYNEGWDSIDIAYNYYNQESYWVQNFLNLADKFDQKNIHHSFTLGEHSRRVHEYLCNKGVPSEVSFAGLLHDNAKLHTQTFTDHKGNPSETSHFYGHESAGAYEYLFYGNKYRYSKYEILFGALLIELHMRMYNLKTEKAKNKVIDIIGEEGFKYLTLLHEADRASK